MDSTTSFGAWLKQRRQALDLTREELAERVGCALETIRKIEVDRRRPSKQIAELLALHLGVSLAERADFLRFARGERPAEVEPEVVERPALGKYELVSLLHRGPASEVYKAYQPRLDRYVALKVFGSSGAPAFLQRFERELLAVVRLRHPHIAFVYDYDFDAGSGRCYLVREFLDGPSLRARLQQLGDAPPHPQEALRIFLPLSSAVDYAHGAGVAHRSLSPSNILFTGDGHAVLTDFGAISELDRALEGAPPAEPPSPYRAPEQGLGRPGDSRSDIYALGVILYQLLTGQLPPREGGVLNLRGGDVESARRVEQVVRRALSPRPGQRYQSAREFAEALCAALGLEADLSSTPLQGWRDEAGAVVIRNAGPSEGPTVPPEPDSCPYRGLFAFGEEDSPLFFGREAVTERVLAALDRQPLVGVIGPSGSGKSSLLFAGVLPRLRQALALHAAQGRSWVIVELRPGAQPLHALAAALLPLLGGAGEARHGGADESAVAGPPDAATPPTADEASSSAAQQNASLLLDASLLPTPAARAVAKPEAEAASDTRAQQGPSDPLLARELAAPSAEEVLAAPGPNDAGDAAPAFGVDLVAGGSGRLAEVERLQAQLADPRSALAPLLESILASQPGAHRVLLAVDQFEELYTLCSDPATRQRFIELLLEVAAMGAHRPEPPATALLTLRADFMGQVLQERAFADALQEGGVILGPMTRAELRLAIAGPAEKQGLGFEAGLVDRLLDDVGREPGTLPLLEFALTLLWERREAGLLTHAAYDEIGQVEGALARYADQVFDELGAAEQAQARALFVQLVQPGEGTEDTRRVATRDELGAAGWALCQHLADRRLVVTDYDAAGQEIAEVAHEALIQSWARLRGWMEQDRLFRRWQERLRAALRQWQASAEDAGALLRGAPLAEAEGWLAEREAELSPAERGYIAASAAHRDQEQAEREAARQRELDLQTRSARRLRRLAALLVVALLFAGGAAFIATRAQRQADANARQADANARQSQANAQRAETSAALSRQSQQESERQAAVSRARELAAAADVNLDVDPERSMLLALAAYSETQELGLPTLPEVEESLHRAVQSSRLVRTIDAHEGGVTSVAFSPHENILVSAGHDGVMRSWNIVDGSQLWQQNANKDTVIQDVAFSPDGRQIATINRVDYSRSLGYFGAQALQFWEVKNGDLIQSFACEWDLPSGTSVNFSPDGSKIALIAANHARVFDTQTNNWTYATGVREDYVFDVEFDRNNDSLIMSSQDDTLTFWDIGNATPTAVITGTNIIGFISIAMSPDGKTIAVSTNNGSILFIDSTSHEIQNRISVSRSFVTHIAFTPDGAGLAAAASDGSLIILNLQSGQERIDLNGHTAEVLDLSFSSDGQYLATGSKDGSIKIWALQPQDRLYTLGQLDNVGFMRFSPDGKSFSATTRTPRLEDINTGALNRSQRTVIYDFSADKVLVDFSEDLGEIIDQEFVNGAPMFASCCEDQHIQIWDLKNKQITNKFLVDRGYVRALDLSSNGKFVALNQFHPEAPAAEFETISVWDLESKQKTAINAPTKITETISGMQISNNGKFLLLWYTSRGKIYLWNTFLDKEVFSLDLGRTLSIYSRFDSDDHQIVVNDGNGVLHIWDILQLKEVQSITLENAEIIGLYFSPDGKTIITIGRDNQLNIWNIETGKKLRSFQASGVLNGTIAISPDERYVVVGGEDGSMVVYPYNVEGVVELVRSRLTRSWTQAECVQYFDGRECPAHVVRPPKPVSLLATSAPMATPSPPATATPVPSLTPAAATR